MWLFIVQEKKRKYILRKNIRVQSIHDKKSEKEQKSKIFITEDIYTLQEVCIYLTNHIVQ